MPRVDWMCSQHRPPNAPRGAASHGRHAGRAPRGARQGLPLRLEGPLPRRLRAEAGLERARRRGDLRAEGRARLDAEVPPEEPALLRHASDAVVGRRPERDRLPEHLLLHPLHGEAGRELGRAARGHPGHLGQAGHARRRAEVPGGRERAVRERGRLPQDQGRARPARGAVHRHGHRAARPSRPRDASTSAR